MKPPGLPSLLKRIRACEICTEHLPEGPRPALGAHRDARKGSSGDLPPRPECAPEWHDAVLERMLGVRLTLLLSRYAHARYLGARRRQTLTETVRAWRDYTPRFLPLPHPSPRNNVWLRKHPWFEDDVLPYPRRRVRSALSRP